MPEITAVPESDLVFQMISVFPVSKVFRSVMGNSPRLARWALESDLAMEIMALHVLEIFPFIMEMLLGLQLLATCPFVLDISMQLDQLLLESYLALRAGTALPGLEFFAFMMEM
jgi:hypothetical protein